MRLNLFLIVPNSGSIGGANKFVETGGNDLSIISFPLEKIFTMGRRSYTVKVNVPMCDLRFEAASFKGTAEKFVGTLGVIVGILAGLFAAITLMPRWQGTGEGNLILNLFAGGVFGRLGLQNLRF